MSNANVVKFTLSVDEARAVQAFLKLQGAQGKAAAGAKSWGDAADRSAKQAGLSVDQLRAKISATQRAQLQAAARSTVAQTQLATQGVQNLNLTQTARQMLRQGGTGQAFGQIQDISFQRFLAAQRIKDDRAFQTFLKSRPASTSMPTPIPPDMKATKRADPVRQTESMASAAGYAAAGLGALTAGIGSALGALRAVAGVAEKIDAERMQTVASKQFSAMDMNSLRQVYRTQKELDAGVAMVGDLRAKTGIDEATAAGVVFGLRSVGIDQDANTMPTLQRARRLGINPMVATNALATVRANYGAGFDLETVLAKAMVSSSDAAKADVSGIVGGIGQSAASMKAMGGTLEEQLALLGVFSDVFKSVDVGSERAGSLANALAKNQDRIKWQPGQKAGSFLGILDQLAGLEQAGQLRSESGKVQNIRDFIGDQGAVSAYEMYVANRDRVNTVTADIGRARGGQGSIIRERAALKIGATDLAEILTQTTNAGQVAKEKAHAEVIAAREIIMTARRAEGMITNPWDTATLGDASDWAQRLKDPLKSEALSTFSIARYVPDKEHREHIFDAIARSADVPMMQERLRLAKYISQDTTNKMGEREVADEELAILGKELRRRTSSTGLSINAAVDAINSTTEAPDVKQFNAAVETLNRTAMMMEKVFGGVINSPARFTPAVHRR